MNKRFLLFILVLGVVFTGGCRTGEYNVDLLIYEEMPALLAANETLVNLLEKNEDGSLKVEFEKGEMFLHIRTGSDMHVTVRQEATQAAFEIFHQAYMGREENLRKDETFYRQKIYVHGFVEDTELYVLEWDLNEAEPNVLDNREANYM